MCARLSVGLCPCVLVRAPELVSATPCTVRVCHWGVICASVCAVRKCLRARVRVRICASTCLSLWQAMRDAMRCHIASLCRHLVQAETFIVTCEERALVTTDTLQVAVCVLWVWALLFEVQGALEVCCFGGISFCKKNGFNVGDACGI